LVATGFDACGRLYHEILFVAVAIAGGRQGTARDWQLLWRGNGFDRH
jgi:hypothetical protein